MDKLIILLWIVLFFLLFKSYFNNLEPFSQDFYPHQYASNIIPCSPRVN